MNVEINVKLHSCTEHKFCRQAGTPATCRPAAPATTAPPTPNQPTWARGSEPRRTEPRQPEPRAQQPATTSYRSCSSTNPHESTEGPILDSLINSILQDFQNFNIALDKIENTFSTTGQNSNKSIQDFLYPGVVNLSSYHLSKSELSLLSKGLKFCPTPPKFDPGVIKSDIDKFFLSIKRFLHFDNPKQNLTDSSDDSDDSDTSTDSYGDSTDPPPFQHQKLKIKSSWDPPHPSQVDHVHQLIVDEILECEARQHYPRNMFNDEYKAIHSLSQNHQIIIKKADKGSNIVVMDTKNYIQEGLRQLSDQESYECTHEENLTEKHFNEIKKVVESLHDEKEISKKKQEITFYQMAFGLHYYTSSQKFTKI